MTAIVKVISVRNLTHNVWQVRMGRPIQYQYEIGQAMEVSVDLPQWKERKNIFTISSIPSDDFLEVIVKIMPHQEDALRPWLELKVGQHLIVSEAFGGVEYKGEGAFIAGGVGITPFLAIFKELEKKKALGNNQVFFANRTKKDIFYQDELEKMFGEKFINILSDEKTEEFPYGMIDEEFLKTRLNRALDYFYLCGPQPMMKSVSENLRKLGVQEEQIIRESF